jgi:hypothetical protein
MNVFYQSSPLILRRIIYSYSTGWISCEYYPNAIFSLHAYFAQESLLEI